nr:restriction endonuclease subunit S [Maritalea mediterranea]
MVGEVCDSIVDCKNRTAPKEDFETPYKMIRTTNVRDGWVDTTNVNYVNRETYEKWTSRQIPIRDDVLLTREAPLGEVGKIRTDENLFLGQRIVSYRADRKKIDPDFLLYSFLCDDVQGQIRAFGSGSTVEHMRVPDAKLIKIAVPPLPIQKRIAGILSAYDDLIAVNERRIAILEEMARRVFEEWFIGTSDEMVASVDLIEFDPKEKLNKGKPIRFVPMSSISETHMTIGAVQRRASSSGAKFRNGDTLFARITPCTENGKTGHVMGFEHNEVVCGSTEFIVMRARSVPPAFVYCLARHSAFRKHAIQSMGGSDGRQRVKRNALEQFTLAKPDPLQLRKFDEFASPAFQQILQLAKQNTNLRATRDLLIPRLVSGEIDVSEAPKPVAAE